LPINSFQSLFAAKKASSFAAGFGFVRSLNFLDIEIFISKQILVDFYQEICEIANGRFVRLFEF